MNKMSRHRSTIKWTAVLAFTLIGATGCTNSLTPVTESGYLPAETESYLAGDTPQKTYLQNQTNGSYGKVPVSNANESGGDTSAESSAESSSTPAAGKQQWNAARPVMLGLAIGDTNTQVTERYGIAADIYSLEDEAETIEVHEYKGFAVGINKNKRIQYIEVYDKSITTGLSGIQVEDSAKDVLKALGKPSSQNSYIITYQGNNSLLKFDLDPERGQIVSIKLLAAA